MIGRLFLAGPFFRLIGGRGGSRAPHIIGLRCPIGLPNGLIERLQADRIYISQRKGTLRISPHLYNTNSDVDRLFEALGRMI